VRLADPQFRARGGGEEKRTTTTTTTGEPACDRFFFFFFFFFSFFLFLFLIFYRIDSGSSSETRKRETGRGTAEDEKSYGEEVRRNEEGKERKGKAEVERNEGTEEEEEEEEESGGMGCFWSRHHDAEAPTLDVVESQRPELGLWFFFCVFLVSIVVELWRSFLLCCC
jgi:hypothetical protein